MSENDIVEPPQVEETPVEAVVTTPEPVEKPKETFDETLERVAKEAITGVARGSDGKFQSRVVAQGAPETPEVPGKSEGTPPEPAPQAIEAPNSLPDAVKQAWPTLPRAIQEAWSKREGEAHAKITSDGQRLQTLGALEEVAKSVDARLKQVNAPAHEYFRRLAVADQLLTQDGVRGIQEIARMYGINLGAALQNPQAQQYQQPQDINAQIQEGVQKELQKERIANISKEIDQFRAALPVEEQADFDKLESVMTGLASAKAQPIAELYKAARRADPETSAKDEAKAKAEAEEKAKKDAKEKADKDSKLAALGKRPGSTPAAPIKGQNIWDTMDKIGAEVLARG